MHAFDAFVLLVAAFASARIAVLLVHDIILDGPRGWFFRRFPPQDNPMEGYSYQAHDKLGHPIAPLYNEGVHVNARRWYLFSEVFTCTRCLTVWTTVPVFFASREWNWALVTAELIAAMAIASWGAKKL